MERNNFIYKETERTPGSRRLMKGCIACSASRCLINARRKVFLQAKKPQSHGIVFSAKRVNGRGSEVMGSCKAQQTRKDLSFCTSFVRSSKKGEETQSKDYEEEEEVRDMDDLDYSENDIVGGQEEHQDITGCNNLVRSNKENEVNIHELRRLCLYLLSHSVFLNL
jgi:hypothetical protein